MYLLVNKKTGIMQLVGKNAWDDFVNVGIYSKSKYVTYLKKTVSKFQELFISIKITPEIQCFILNTKEFNNNTGVFRFKASKVGTLFIVNSLIILSYLCRYILFIKNKGHFSDKVKRQLFWFFGFSVCLYASINGLLIVNDKYHIINEPEISINKMQQPLEIIKAVQKLPIEQRIHAERDFVFEGDLIPLGVNHPIYFLPLGNAKDSEKNTASRTYAIISSVNEVVFFSRHNFMLYKSLSTNKCGDEFIFSFTSSDLLLVVYKSNNINTKVKIIPWSSALDKQYLNTKCAKKAEGYFGK